MFKGERISSIVLMYLYPVAIDNPLIENRESSDNELIKI